MMSAASSRDTERRERYTKHKDTEISDTIGNQEGKAQFLHDFKVNTYSASNSTVESKIKSGIFSKQRTKAALDRNFLKK